MSIKSSYKAKQATGKAIEAIAVVSPVTFSARYDLDRTNGIICRQDHPLRGTSIIDTVLVAPGVQGGVAGGWAFLAMKGLGVGFKGLVFGAVNPVMVQGAVAAGIPIFAGIDLEIFDEVKTGDRIFLDPLAKTVSISKI